MVNQLTLRSATLSPESKAYLRKVLGAEAEEMIAAHEAAEQPHLGYQDLAADRVDLTGLKTDSRSVAGFMTELKGVDSGVAVAQKGVALLGRIPQENTRARLEVVTELLHKLKDDDQVGVYGKLGLAALGASELPDDVAPYDSLVERSLTDYTPGTHLLPAALKAIEAAEQGEPKPSEFVALASEMYQSLEWGENGFEKLYAGIRLALATAGEFGELRESDAPNDEHLAMPLRNLKRHATLPGSTVRVWEPMVLKSFESVGMAAKVVEQHMQLVDHKKQLDRGNAPLPGDYGQDDIEMGIDSVTIGDVVLDIQM